MAFTITVNGHIYTSDPADTSAADGYRFIGYGYISALANLAVDIVAVMATQVGLATTQADNAAASAATAINAPGTSATSATNDTIALGSTTITIQAGKLLVVGMSVKIASTAGPTNWMAGDVTAYNSGTGSLTVNVTKISGSGTLAAWTVSLSGPAGADAGISNVVDTAVSVTLTSTPTLVVARPTAYGMTVKLPDPATCATGDTRHAVDNQGSCPVRIVDMNNLLKGFVFPKVYAPIGLTSGAVWSIANVSPVGGTAHLGTTSLRTNITAIDLGSGQELILGSNSSGHLYGVVYDSITNLWSAPTAIRVANVDSVFAACLCAAGEVLIVSALTTAYEAVVVTVAAGAISNVGTPETKTLSAAISFFAAGSTLTAIGGSYVLSYKVATPALQLRAITVSGTTPTTSTATVVPGDQGGILSFLGSVAVVASYTAGSVYVTPYTISGSTAPAVGTGVTDAVTGGGTIKKFAKMSSGRWAIIYEDNSTAIGGFASLSGAVITTSIVTIFASNNTFEAMQVGSNKVLCTDGGNSVPCYNLLTDTAGVASAGTAIDIEAAAMSRIPLYASGTNAVVIASSANKTYLHTIDCSGASPVLSKSTFADFGSSSGAGGTSQSDIAMSRHPYAVFGANAAYRTPISNTLMFRAVDGALLLAARTEFYGDTYSRGATASSMWLSDSRTGITKVECVA